MKAQFRSGNEDGVEGKEGATVGRRTDSSRILVVFFFLNNIFTLRTSVPRV